MRVSVKEKILINKIRFVVNKSLPVSKTLKIQPRKIKVKLYICRNVLKTESPNNSYLFD